MMKVKTGRTFFFLSFSSFSSSIFCFPLALFLHFFSLFISLCVAERDLLEAMVCGANGSICSDQ